MWEGALEEYFDGALSSIGGEQQLRTVPRFLVSMMCMSLFDCNYYTTIRGGHNVYELGLLAGY